MTGKEETKEIHIDFKSIDKKKIMEESDPITKFRNDIYDMMQKEIIRFTTPLKFEISELNKKLTKYKRAFEILKRELNIQIFFDNEWSEPMWVLDGGGNKEISKEEYELLEELLND